MRDEDKTTQERKSPAGRCDCCPPEAMADMMSMYCGSTAQGKSQDMSERMATCCESAACCPSTAKQT